VRFNTSVGVIENIGYADGDGFAANDWTATVDATGITWNAPAATTPPAELDYASFVSFRFDSTQAPAQALANLGVFEAGSPMQLGVQALAPAAALDYFALTPCRLLDTRTAAGGAAPIPSGTVRELDVPAVSACGVPANAFAVAINITEVGATNGGELAVYPTFTPPTTAGTVSFNAGVVRTNNAVALLSPDGKLKIKPSLTGGGSTHVVVDVVGYFVP